MESQASRNCVGPKFPIFWLSRVSEFGIRSYGLCSRCRLVGGFWSILFIWVLGPLGIRKLFQKQMSRRDQSSSMYNGPKDPINIRIPHSGPRPATRRMLEITVCSILLFMCSFLVLMYKGGLRMMVHGPQPFPKPYEASCVL